MSTEIREQDPSNQPCPSKDPAIREGFRWDDCDAYLFDIDGTLMHAQGGVHMDSFTTSVLEVLGQPLPLDHVLIHGNTDTGILRDAFARAGIAETVWQPRLPEILEGMCAAVTARREQIKIVLHPGVPEVLAYLKARGKLLGVATGNLERIGWLKVELAGLRPFFSFGGFSDRDWSRTEMIGNAAQRARQILGAQGVSRGAVCVVGDTPYDIVAAHANSLPVIAVSTGVYSFAELQQNNPEAVTGTLANLLVQAGTEG